MIFASLSAQATITDCYTIWEMRLVGTHWQTYRLIVTFDSKQPEAVTAKVQLNMHDYENKGIVKIIEETIVPKETGYPEYKFDNGTGKYFRIDVTSDLKPLEYKYKVFYPGTYKYLDGQGTLSNNCTIRDEYAN